MNISKNNDRFAYVKEIFLTLTSFFSKLFVVVFTIFLPNFPILNVFDRVGGAFVGVGGRLGRLHESFRYS